VVTLRAGRESSRLSVMFRHVAAARLGLTVTDMECLDFLMDSGTATAGQLAERTHLTTGAITSMIRRLERDGYVTAVRRRVIVTLVPERLEAGAQVYAPFGDAVTDLLSRYTPAEIRLLTRHYDAMSTIYRAQLSTLGTE